MLSQFFILSGRGDTIILRDFRQDLGRETCEVFYRKVNLFQGDPPPSFNIHGLNYFFTKKFGIYFVATTKYNVSPSFIMDIIYRMMKVFRDYCGVLNEESIRKNFVLIYEIIDEIIDYGHPQLMATENIRQYTVSDAVVIQPQIGGKDVKPKKRGGIFSIFSKQTAPSTAVTRPMSNINPQANTTGKPAKKSKSDANEIFVDIFEKLSVLFNANGTIINSSIDGVIQMKSYLRGNPGLRLVLNDDLVVGRDAVGPTGSVMLDDCSFHECVDTRDWDALRTLAITPPDGEFLVMNYRINSDYQTPYRIYPFIDELSQYKLQFTLKIKATQPHDKVATQLVAKFALPRDTANVTFELPKGVQGQHTEHKTVENVAEWSVKKFTGGQEHTLICKIALKSMPANKARKEIGPVSLNFEIPMFNVSKLQVKYLKIQHDEKGYNPYRWVRYVTQSSSYVCRC